MEELQKAQDEGEEDEEGGEGELEVEILMARFEDLIERRPLLLNSVLLRQNPHNVSEWLKRVELLAGNPHEIISTYTEAVQTVDPKQAVGKLQLLWINFAKFYEMNKQLADARIIFEKATHVAFMWTTLRPSGASGPRWNYVTRTTTKPSPSYVVPLHLHREEFLTTTKEKQFRQGTNDHNH